MDISFSQVLMLICENVSHVETLLIQTDPNIQVTLSLLFICLHYFAF